MFDSCSYCGRTDCVSGAGADCPVAMDLWESAWQEEQKSRLLGAKPVRLPGSRKSRAEYAYAGFWLSPRGKREFVIFDPRTNKEHGVFGSLADAKAAVKRLLA